MVQAISPPTQPEAILLLFLRVPEYKYTIIEPKALF